MVCRESPVEAGVELWMSSFAPQVERGWCECVSSWLTTSASAICPICVGIGGGCSEIRRWWRSLPRNNLRRGGNNGMGTLKCEASLLDHQGWQVSQKETHDIVLTHS